MAPPPPARGVRAHWPGAHAAFRCGYAAWARVLKVLCGFIPKPKSDVEPVLTYKGWPCSVCPYLFLPLRVLPYQAFSICWLSQLVNVANRGHRAATIAGLTSASSLLACLILALLDSEYSPFCVFFVALANFPYSSFFGSSSRF